MGKKIPLTGTGIRLSPQAIAALQEIAEKEGTTRSKIIQAAVDEFLAKRTTNIKRPQVA